MKQKMGLVLFASLIFTSLAMALDEDTLPDASRPETPEELSSKIQPPLPYVSPEDAAEINEAVRLIKELEREIFLTNQLIDLREGKIPAVREKAVEQPAPEEIVIAKQVSEEPAASLPREEKSLITELEKKDEAEKRAYVSGAPGFLPKVDIYSKKELGKDETSVVVEKEQTILVRAPAFKRFMVTDPNILQVAGEDSGRIRITAVGLGKTFLHVWDSEGRRTIKVTIVQKGRNAFTEARKRTIQASQPESFKVRYSFDSYHLNSESDNPTRSFYFKESFHRLGITGETPWGRATSRIQYQGRKEGSDAELRRDLSAWDFNLRGEDLEISLGDTGAHFSDITIPQTGFQGARFRNPDSENINYDVIWGARGNRMWGYKVLDFDDANYFYGARGQIEPAPFIHFNATMARSLEDEENAGEYLYAAGTGLNFLEDAVIIEGEAARSKNEETDQHVHAYKVDSIIRMKDYNLTFKGTYRDIDTNFRTVTGTGLPYTGELGYYLDAYYQPLKYLRVTGQYNTFRQRENPNLTETQRYNRDWRGTVNFNIGENTQFNYFAWNRMREGQNPPTRGYGESYQISHIFPKPPLLDRPINLFFQYEPSQYRNLDASTSDYKEKKYTGGMRMNVFKNFYYDIQHKWHYRRMLSSGESGTVKTFSTGAQYSTQIFKTPFYSSMSLRYNEERDVMENLPITSGESTVTGQAEIKYRPSGDFETYLRANYKYIRGVLDSDQDRQERRIYAGGSYLFDSTLRWDTGGSVRGFVFKDLNGNGQKEPEEEGFSGINVYAGEYKSTTTDNKGFFELRKIKGADASIMFDTKMIPRGYKPTSPNPQLVKLERDLVSELYFGAMAASEISGIAFNDVNMNEVFDEGDLGVKGALLKLDDGAMTQTMAGGYYRIEDVRAGAKTITLDTMSLPPNMSPLTKSKRTLEVEEGWYYEENFPLYALRTVVGTVFIDKNGNNTFDAGEKGVADIQVRAEENIALTDDMGRFFLKKLKGGAQEIEVDISSIPEGYEISGDHFREVTLLPEGEIREDVDFPLRRK